MFDLCQPQLSPQLSPSTYCTHTSKTLRVLSTRRKFLLLARDSAAYPRWNSQPPVQRGSNDGISVRRGWSRLENLNTRSRHHFVLRSECAVRAWTRRFCASSCGWFVVLGVARPDHWPRGCQGWFLGVWWHLAVWGLICHQQRAALLSTFHWLPSTARFDDQEVDEDVNSLFALIRVLVPCPNLGCYLNSRGPLLSWRWTRRLLRRSSVSNRFYLWKYFRKMIRVIIHMRVR